MLKFRVFVLFVSCLLLLAGCGGGGPIEGGRKMTIKVTDGRAGEIEGVVKANSPQTAGMGTRSFKFAVPGELTFDAGPSEYTITFYNMNSTWMKNYEILVDGEPLKRGRDMVVEDDKGPRITLTLESKEAEAK